MRATVNLLVVLLVSACTTSTDDKARDTEDTVETDPPETDRAETDAPVTACVPTSDLPADPLVPGGEVSYQIGEDDAEAELVEIQTSYDRSRLYAAGKPGLLVYDLTNPDAPVEVGRYLATGGILDRIEPDGDRVWACARDSSLIALDVSDPSAITVALTLPTQDPAAMAVVGPWLVAVTRGGEAEVWTRDGASQLGSTTGLRAPWEVVAHGTTAWVADNSLGVVPIDLADPAAPAVQAPVTLGGAVQDVAVSEDGSTLLAAAGAAGLIVLDLTNPSAPVERARLRLGRAVISVSIDGSRAWAATQSDVIALDVSEPATPRVLATEHTPGWAMHIDGNADRAWVADWYRVGSYTLDPSALAPDLVWTWDVLEVPRAGGTTQTTWSNLGSAPLEIQRLRHNPAITITPEHTTLAPGASMQVEVTYEGGASAFKDNVCVLTNDPDTPLRLLTVATSRGGDGTHVGQQAPDFVARDLDGVTYRLSEHRGVPVVLAYFATW